MTFPISLLMQIATRPQPLIEPSKTKSIGFNRNLDLPKIELKENRPKYSFGWTNIRKIYD